MVPNMNASVPKCLAIVICESVVEDARTHNKCILNSYNTIWAFGFPTTQDRMTVFVSLTDGRGKVPLEVRFAKDGAEKEVFSLKGDVAFKSPLDVVDLTVDMRQVPLPEEGNYAIQIYISGEMIAERRLKVAKAAQGA